MVKFFENKSTFNFKWDQVAQAYWRRYPNPESDHVLSEDTIFREVRDGKLYSKRLFTKTNSVPKWGERFISNRVVKILEESIVDPKAKTLTTYTRNIGYSSVMAVAETVVYSPCPEDANKTVAVRQARVDSNVYGFAKAIQAFGVKRFKKNCSKAVRGFDHVLHAMFPQTTQEELRMASSSHSTIMAVSAAHPGEKLKGMAKKAGDFAAKSGQKLPGLQVDHRKMEL